VAQELVHQSHLAPDSFARGILVLFSPTGLVLLDVVGEPSNLLELVVAHHVGRRYLGKRVSRREDEGLSPEDRLPPEEGLSADDRLFSLR